MRFSPRFLLAALCASGLYMSSATGWNSPVQAAECERFSSCLQQTLQSQTSLERVILSTRALKLWNPSIPQRDLLNVLKLRAEGLIKLHESGQAAHLNPLTYAREDYERFLKMAPGHWLPLSGLGRIAELKNQPAEAKTWLNRAVKTRQVGAFAARAAFLMRQQRWRLALNDINEALSLDKHNQQRAMGLTAPQRGALYALRSQIQTGLRHPLEARLDKDEACQLGHQAAC